MGVVLPQMLNPEDHGAGGEAVEGFDFGEGFAQEAEGAGVEKEDHVDEVLVGVVRIDGRVGAGNADAGIGEDGGDFGDHAGAVGHLEAHIGRGGGVLDGDDLAVAAVREEATMTSRLVLEAGGLHEV